MQNIGTSPPLAATEATGQAVESVEKFTYLGSNVDSSGYTPLRTFTGESDLVVNHGSTGSRLAQQASKALYESYVFTTPASLQC